MKLILLFTLCLLFFWSCKKEAAPVAIDQYLANVKADLTDSLPSSTFQNLDFSRSVLNHVDSVDLYVLRVPFKGIVESQDFVVVKTNRQGEVQRGRIVHLELTVSDAAGKIHKKNVNGSLILRSLQGAEELRSSIENGYVKAFHQNEGQRTSLEMAPDVLPEVIITYVRHLSSGISFSTWCMVQTFIMDYGGGGGGSLGGYYGSLDNLGGSTGGGGGSTGGNPTGGGPTNGETILVDVETQDERTAIDIEKFINCFNSIPNAGANCTIEIRTDIPVDSDPNKIFDLSKQSPGHTFLTIRKQNASQSASQNIGFYPRSGWKTILTNAPLDGKFVDNGNHEFNAGFIQTITPAQLQNVLLRMQQDKNMMYDIDNFNCTDWALDVFNAAGAFQLDVPLYDIPGNYPSSGTHMPGGVYNRLRDIKNTNSAQSVNVDINFLKAYAGTSTGPCN